MLPRASRLTRSADFQRAVRRGRRAACPTLVLHAVRAPSASAGKVGFVVSRAVGNAVVRNQVQRRLRHAVRPLLGRLDAVHLVVRANPSAATADFHQLADDLERCLAKVESGTR